MSELVPEPDEGEAYYELRVKGSTVKPSAWNGFVLAESVGDARALIRDAHPSVGLGIQGIGGITARGAVATRSTLLDLLHGAMRPNAVVFREGNEVRRVHRGMLGDR